MCLEVDIWSQSHVHVDLVICVGLESELILQATFLPFFLPLASERLSTYLVIANDFGSDFRPIQ